MPTTDTTTTNGAYGSQQEPSVLWVDDQIQRYSPWIQRLEDVGLHVSPSDNLSHGMELLEQHDYQVVLIDLMMGHESCISALEEVATAAKGAKVFICSAFLYLEEFLNQYKNTISKSGIPIGILDKTSLPFPDDEPAFLSFVEKLNSDEFLKSSIQNMFGAQNETISEHFSISELSWPAYQGMNINEKLSILDIAYLETQETRKTLEDQGYNYFVFCGDFETPVFRSKSLRETLSEKELLEIADRKKKPPFTFSTGGIIDDTSVNCCARNGLARYPTIGIGYADEIEEVHFDTGNSYTLLSHEWYAEKGWWGQTNLPGIYSAGEMHFRGRHVDLDPVSFSDSVGTTIDAPLKGFAAFNWASYRIAAKCGPACTNSNYKNGDPNQLCKFRTGLLGRNLPIDLDVNITNDFVEGKTSFRKRR